MKYNEHGTVHSIWKNARNDVYLIKERGISFMKKKDNGLKAIICLAAATVAVGVASIAVSSIVTTIIIIVGVILLITVEPIGAFLSSPVLQPAFDQILPALFGGLAVVFISKNLKLSIAPIVLMLGLFIFVPALNEGTVGIMVPVGVIFTVIVSRIMYKKGMI